MKIWSLQEDVNIYEHVTLADNERWIEFSDMFEGKKLLEDWKQLCLKLIPHSGNLKTGICHIFLLEYLYLVIKL